MLEKNIKFICKRELKVEFCSLVINVESIENLYPNGFEAFFLNEDFFGQTNGFLFVSNEMMNPPPYLYSIIDKLERLGFKHGRDYVLGMDEPTVGTNGAPVDDFELPWCEKLEWVRSLVSYGNGNIVWHNDFNVIQEIFIMISKLESNYEQPWMFWYNLHPVMKQIRFKKLESEYLPLNILRNRVDIVSKKIFNKVEKNRIPIFIGSQFGIIPEIATSLDTNYSGYAGILSMSLLSGQVFGFGIHVVEEHSLRKKIVFIINE